MKMIHLGLPQLRSPTNVTKFACLLVGASVSHGRNCLDKFFCCLPEEAKAAPLSESPNCNWNQFEWEKITLNKPLFFIKKKMFCKKTDDKTLVCQNSGNCHARHMCTISKQN